MSVHDPIPPLHAPHLAGDYKVGGEKLGPKTTKPFEIQDGTDAIGFIEGFVTQHAKAESFGKCTEFKIKGTFEKVGKGGPIKAFSYRNPPSRLDVPDCYSFKRIWEVEFINKKGEEQTLTFTKNIYTNVAIPKNSRDINYMQDKEYLATLGASTYCNFVELALRGRCGGPEAGSQAYQKIKDHVTKVMKDNRLNMSFFQGENKIKQKDLNKRFGLSSSHMVTHARVNIRAGGEKSQDEAKSGEYLDIDLREKVNTKAGEILSRAQKHRRKKVMLVAEDSSSPEIRELAKIQNYLYVEKKMEEGEELKTIMEELESAQIDEDQLARYLESKNQRLHADFEDNWNFFVNAERIQALQNRFSEYAPVSDDVKSLLEVEAIKESKFSKFTKRLVSKKEPPRGVADPLRKLLECKDDNLKEEIDKIVACYYRAHQEMKKLSDEQSKNEEKLIKLATNDSEVKHIQAQAASRKKTLEKYSDLFKEFGITADILEKIKPPKRPEPPAVEEPPEEEEKKIPPPESKESTPPPPPEPTAHDEGEKRATGENFEKEKEKEKGVG